MKTELSHLLPGGNPSKRRPRKTFPLGAPRALIAPVEALLDTARAMTGAPSASAFAIEGNEVTLLAHRGPGEPPPGRLAARALAEGKILSESSGTRVFTAIPMATAPTPGSERRRFRQRSTIASACLVLESAGAQPCALPAAAGHELTRALLSVLEARAFADIVATDRSTGALTRPAFERAATNELAAAGTAGRPAALVLLEVVPRGGRVEVQAAEDAMAQAAIALRRALRTDDLVGRRGPDELAALLLDVDPDHLEMVIQRVMDRAAEALDEVGLERPVLGAARFPGDGSSLDEIDSAALDALERARSLGPGSWKLHDRALGHSPTSCRRSFFTGDPGLDARKAGLLFESILAANAASEPREALDAVLRALLAATGADRAAILSGPGAKLDVARSLDRREDAPPGRFRYSRSACLRALALGRATFVSDTLSPGEEVGSSAHDLGLRSVVTVPLLGRQGPLGVLYADSLRPSFARDAPEELAYLEALAAQAALAIENAGLRERLEEENAALKRAARSRSDTTMLLGASPAFRAALVHLPEMVEGTSSVLILGESGTGKELLARKIHELGPRARGGFVAQNCAAIPAELLESELFGHAAGAFSGAARAKRGLVELADGGTFFLDEVGDLSLPLQAKLLRVLEDKEVRRVGETRGHKIDFRLVSATNRDLLVEVEEGRFRRDLFYRMNVFTVTLPPLRERREDIPELARHFVARAAARMGRPQPEIAPEAMERLTRSNWPGNARELANVIEKAVAVARDGRIEAVHVGGLGDGEGAPGHPAHPAGPLREVLARVERDLVGDALRAADGNVSGAARALGIARQQLQRLMRKYGVKTTAAS